MYDFQFHSTIRSSPGRLRYYDHFRNAFNISEAVGLAGVRF